jgi:hypothetical protein
MEPSELSNLANSNTGKILVLSQLPDLDFDASHAATPVQRRLAAESVQEARTDLTLLRLVWYQIRAKVAVHRNRVYYTAEAVSWGFECPSQ